ncbi:MAG TPA: sigma-70 family RNA polymerase sigma factor [Xenococcaceae cyanobacterium]
MMKVQNTAYSANNLESRTNQHKPLAKINAKSAPTQTKKSAQDSVQNYLQTIGQIPLLSGEAEIELSRQVSDLLELEAIRQQLTEELGRQPREQEWATQVNLSLKTLRHRLYLGRKARNQMVQANLRLVVFIAKKYLKQGLSLQDLIQEGNLGLIRAVERFDPEKGCKFSTYAYWWIRQSMTKAIAEQSRTIRLPVHIHDKLALIKKTFKLLSQRLQRHPNEIEMAEQLKIGVEQLRFLLRVTQLPLSLEVPVDREDDSRLLGEGIESDLPTPEEWIVKKLMGEEVEHLLSYLSTQERDILRLSYGLDDGKVKTSAEIGQILQLSRSEIQKIRARAMSKLRRLFHSSSAKQFLA